MRSRPSSAHWPSAVLCRIEQAKLLDPRVVPSNQPFANVPAIADVRDQDAIRQAVCALLRGSDAVAHPGHDHGPPIDSTRDQFAVLEAELAIMQVRAIRSRQ